MSNVRMDAVANRGLIFPFAESYGWTKSSNTPRDVKTSGITQVPIHAMYVSYFIAFKKYW